MRPFTVSPLIGLVLLALGLSCPALAERTGGEPRQDVPLDRRVSVAVARPRLPHLLAVLRREAGIDMTCEATLAHRRLVVLAEERPLREVMEQMAAFTGTPPGHCVWDRRPDGGYQLREDKASGDARLLLRTKRDRDFTERFRLAQTAVDMTPEERATKLRGVAPRLAHRPPGLTMPLVRELMPAQIQFVKQGGVLDLGYDDMSPALQARIRQRAAGVNFVVSHAPEGGPETPVYTYNGRKDYRSARLTVCLAGSPDRPGLALRIALTPKDGLSSGNILDPGPPPPEERPQWLRDALKQEEAARRSRGLKAPTGRDPALERRVTIRALTVIPHGFPDAGVKVSCTVSDCLEQLSRQAHLPVIAHFDPCFADYYARQGSRELHGDLHDLTVREAMERLAVEFQVTWDKRGDWIRVWSERTLYGEMDHMNMAPLWETAGPASGPLKRTGH